MIGTNRPEEHVSAYLKMDKLIINKQMYTVNKLVRLPACVKEGVESRVSVKRTDSVTEIKSSDDTGQYKTIVFLYMLLVDVRS